MATKQCKFKLRINAFVDKELSDQEYLEVKEHLINCPVCQQELREITRVNSMLNSYSSQDPSQATIERILSFSENRFNKNPSKWLISGSIAASFIIGLVLSSLTFSSTIQSQSSYQIGNESLYSYFIGEENVQ